MDQTQRDASLCKPCRAVFIDSKPQYGNSTCMKKLWQPSVGSFEKSIEEGCYLCSMVSHDLRNEWPSYHDWDTIERFSVEINLAPRIRRDGYEDSQSRSLHSITISFHAEHGSEGRPIGRRLLGAHWLHRVNDAIIQEPTPHTFSESVKAGAASTADLTIAMKWLENCLKTHLACEPDNRPLIPPPARLIHLARRGDQVTSRLIERDEFSKGCQYTTLSHCWGTSPMHSLQRDRLDQFKTEIPVSQLPLTFRNAFDVTLRLGYEYIWIDSLCILQDALDEWAEEASKMADIYEFGVCNIAATAFKSSNSGLFVPKPADIDKPLIISVDLKLQPGLEKVGRFKLIETYYWVSRVDKAPLNRRAWVLQERFFSPRILHFGEDQLLWECNCTRACERMPEGLLLSVRSPSQRGHVSSREIMTLHPRFVKHTWYRFMQEYTMLDLTYPSDRLVGIAGIMKRFGTRLEDINIAGLWSKTFLRDLLWCRGWNVHREFPRACDSRTPTWSWASLNCGIYNSLSKLQPEIAANVQIDTVIANYSQGISELRIRAPLMLVMCPPASLLKRKWGKIIDLRLSTSKVHVRVQFDGSPGDLDGLDVVLRERTAEISHFDNEKPTTSDVASHENPSSVASMAIYLLFISSSAPTAGIVLRRRPEKRGRYSRMGYFDTLGKSKDCRAHDIKDLEGRLLDTLPIHTEDHLESHGGGIYTITII